MGGYVDAWGGEDAEAVSEGRAKGERDLASDGD